MDVLVGVASLVLFGGKTTNDWGGDGTTDRIVVCVPTIKTNFAQRFNAGDHPGKFRLRATLGATKERTVIDATAFALVSLWSDLVAAVDKGAELVVQLDALTLDIARSMDQEFLDPVANNRTQGRV